MRRLLLVMMAAVALGATCSGPSKYELANRETELPARVKQYHDWYQWRDYEEASALVSPRVRAGFMAYTEGLKHGYMVEGYTVTDVNVNPTSDRAAVRVRRSFIKSPSVTLQSEDLMQEWVFEDGGWYLGGPPY